MTDSVQSALKREESVHQSAIEADVASLFKLLTAGLLERPEALALDFKWGVGGLMVAATAADCDVAKLIGGKGRMYHAFKVVLDHYCSQRGIKAGYRVVNQLQRQPVKEIVFTAAKDWPGAAHDEMFTAQCAMLFEPGFELRRVDQALRARTHYLLTLAKDEPAWHQDLQISLSYIWHATVFRHGRLAYLERMERRAS